MNLGFKPSDIKRWDLMGSSLRKSEHETIASNIAKLCKFRKGDEFSDFTFKEYEEFCTHTIGWKEKDVWRFFVDNGYLSQAGNTYSFTDKLLSVYQEFI